MPQPQPQTPKSPSAANPRRDAPPKLLSPSFSRSAFPHSAAAAAVSEQPCVSLLEWWLARVEGDERKIAVAGTFERNQTVQEFTSAPIAKRHEPCVLETEDGIVVLIYGLLNLSQMRDNGFSSKVCEKFLNGFPHWWESCNLKYPKVTSSRTGAQPSSYTSNSGVDSTLFYLEKFQLGKHLQSCASSFISNLLNNAKSFSDNDADVFQKSSYLPNGTPRFEEYTCDGDIATNEIAVASNDDRERYEAVCNEVDNMEIDLTAGSTLRERLHGDIDTNVSLAFTVECADDAGNEEADNAPPTSTCDQRTPVASSKIQGCQDKTQPIELNKKAVTDEDMPTSVYLHVQNSSYLSDGTPRFEEYACVGDIPTNEKAAASIYDSERYADVSKEIDNVGIGLIVGSTLRERGHGDVATNISLAPTVECTNDAGDEGADNTPPISTCRKKTPVASLKGQGCQKKPQRVAPNEKTVDPPKEQRSVHEKLQGATRPPVIRNLDPYAHQSPLTRGRALSLSMSIPEALKLRKTGSGRVIVPTLNAGCQRIVYDNDGSISGVIGLDSPPPSKGSKLKASVRKKRKAH